MRKGCRMKTLKLNSKLLKCYEILSIDEKNRTFKTEDDIQWLFETARIYFSKKGQLRVDEYTSDYDYIKTYHAEVGDYIAITGYHEDGEPTVKILKRYDEHRYYMVPK